ncbi:hypothetical protein HDV57DRAFT_45597 [Trichoderma longibrachiatum]|uniref:Uncharacterized protein n=1 Tax=Trichoderma longibrachiatum ATCC 18648 TaxID=983965 RepID=A0A2T4CH60_TRILO|nr:hypothetical protein M440DRAFT_1002149 [Trichoderma longibrachiatum ATCC 18648]
MPLQRHHRREARVTMARFYQQILLNMPQGRAPGKKRRKQKKNSLASASRHPARTSENPSRNYDEPSAPQRPNRQIRDGGGESQRSRLCAWRSPPLPPAHSIAMSVLRNSKQLCACCLGEDEPSTVRTLGLVRYDRPGCQVATFTGPEPPSKTRGRRRARGDAVSGSQAGQIWCGQLVGGTQGTTRRATEWSSLVQANPPPGRSHSTSTACPRC